MAEMPNPDEHAPGGPDRGSDRAADRPAARDDRYVLVVEDDPEINQLVGAYVKLAGYGYRGAMSGAAAFEELRHHRPALIVLDVMLPDLDGFEICRRIKGDPDTRPVPVVLLTALDGEAYRQRGLACGAAEYLNKPFDPDRLIEAIERHTGSR